jgi:hypothetical protein
MKFLKDLGENFVAGLKVTVSEPLKEATKNLGEGLDKSAEETLKAIQPLPPKKKAGLKADKGDIKPNKTQYGHFWPNFVNSIVSGEGVGEGIPESKKSEEIAVIRMTQLMLLDLANDLSEIHASDMSEEDIEKFYIDRVGERIGDLENHELITKRIEQEEGESSVLEAEILKLVKLLPNEKQILEYIKEKGNNVTLMEIFKKAYELNECFEYPQRQIEMRGKIITMLNSFSAWLDGKPKLKDLLKEILKLKKGKTKEFFQEKAEKDPKAKEQLKIHTEAVIDEFESKAKESKETLEYLYRLKALNGRQVLRFLISERETENKNTVLAGLQVDADTLLEGFVESLSETQKSKMAEICEKKGISIEKNGREWATFLANDILGRKIAAEAKISFDALSKKWAEACDAILERICPSVGSSKVKSFEGLAKQIASSENFGSTAYVVIAINSRNKINELKEQNKNFRKALGKVAKIPLKQSGEPLEVVKKITYGKGEQKGILGKDEYIHVRDRFNRLCHALLDHYKAEKKDPNFAKVNAAVNKCKEAVNQDEESFDRDFLGLMPIAKTLINFRGGMENADEFNFDRLMEAYAKGIKDQGLVNLEDEIEKDIVMALKVELGIGIDDTYADGNKEYLDEEDFAQAKAFSESLPQLPLLKEPKEPKEEKAKEAKEEESDKPKPPEEYESLKKSQKKAVDQFVANLRESVEEATKKKSDKDEKADKGKEKEKEKGK